MLDEPAERGRPLRKIGQLSVQVKKTDKACSLFIRKRDGCCVQCGTPENLTCGHLITRNCKSVRFDLRNLFCQCKSCNMLHEFYPERFTAWWIGKFGQEAYEKLVADSKQIKKWTVEELQELEDGFNKLTEELCD